MTQNNGCGVHVDIPAQAGVEVGLPGGPPGVNGFSPVATVQRNAQGALITITDKTGTTQAQIYDGEVTLDQLLTAFPEDTASGTVATFPDGADGIPAKSLMVDIQPVQEGSGDPSPENVRPIRGWTAVNMWRAGKNLLTYTGYSGSGYNWAVGTEISLTERATQPTISQNAVSLEVLAWENVSFRTPPLPAGDYYFHADISAITEPRCSVYVVDKDDKIVSAINVRTGSVINSKRQLNDGEYILASFASDTAQTLSISDLQIEVGENYSVWEAPKTISLTFPIQSGAVYGGTLDVLAGTLTISYKYSQIFAFTEFQGQSGDLVRVNVNMNDMRPNSRAAGYCNMLKPYSTSSDPPANVIIFGLGISRRITAFFSTLTIGGNTLEAVNNYITNNPLFVAYPLEDPQTYQLTPQEVNTLLGDNNIWADTGPVSVTYRADPTKYIDKKLTALQAQS